MKKFKTNIPDSVQNIHSLSMEKKYKEFFIELIESVYGYFDQLSTSEEDVSFDLNNGKTIKMRDTIIAISYVNN